MNWKDVKEFLKPTNSVLFLNFILLLSSLLISFLFQNIHFFINSFLGICNFWTKICSAGALTWRHEFYFPLPAYTGALGSFLRIGLFSWIIEASFLYFLSCCIHHKPFLVKPTLPSLILTVGMFVIIYRLTFYSFSDLATATWCTRYFLYFTCSTPALALTPSPYEFKLNLTFLLILTYFSSSLAVYLLRSIKV